MKGVEDTDVCGVSMPDYDKPIEIQNATEVPQAIQQAINDAETIIGASDDLPTFRQTFNRTYCYSTIIKPDDSATIRPANNTTGPCIVTRENIHALFLCAMQHNRTRILNFLLAGKFSEKAISEINFGIDESGTRTSNEFSLKCLQKIDMLKSPDTALKIKIFEKIIKDTCRHNMPRQKILQDHKDPASYIQSIEDNIARVKEIAEKVIDAVNVAKDLSDEQKEKLKNEVAIQTQKTLDSNNQKLAETKTQHTARQSTQQPTTMRTEHSTEAVTVGAVATSQKKVRFSNSNTSGNSPSTHWSAIKQAIQEKLLRDKFPVSKTGLKNQGVAQSLLNNYITPTVRNTVNTWKISEERKKELIAAITATIFEEYAEREISKAVQSAMKRVTLDDLTNPQKKPETLQDLRNAITPVVRAFSRDQSEDAVTQLIEEYAKEQFTSIIEMQRHAAAETELRTDNPVTEKIRFALQNNGTVPPFSVFSRMKYDNQTKYNEAITQVLREHPADDGLPRLQIDHGVCEIQFLSLNATTQQYQAETLATIQVPNKGDEGPLQARFSAQPHCTTRQAILDHVNAYQQSVATTLKKTGSDKKQENIAQDLRGKMLSDNPAYRAASKYCKTPADFKKLASASIALRTVQLQYAGKTALSPDERLDILEKELEFRKALYEIRRDNGDAYTGFQFFRSEHTSAKAKLAATDAMLQQLRNLQSPLKRPPLVQTDLKEEIQSGSQQYNAEKYKIAFAPRIDEKTAAQGELGKLYREFLDVKKQSMAINNAPDLTPKPK